MSRMMVVTALLLVLPAAAHAGKLVIRETETAIIAEYIGDASPGARADATVVRASEQPSPDQAVDSPAASGPDAAAGEEKQYWFERRHKAPRKKTGAADDE